MEKLKISHLEQLLHFPGGNGVVRDASVLSCGCLVSEGQFDSDGSNVCPNCHKSEVSIVSSIEPLRELYVLVQSLKYQQSGGGRKRRSSSKKGGTGDSILESTTESMDLLSLFCKFAKEEEIGTDSASKLVSENAQVRPIAINSYQPLNVSNENGSEHRPSTSSTGKLNSPPGMPSSLVKTPPFSANIKSESLDFKEESILSNLNEEKEYNFSKCFPFHRKITTFPTRQLRLNSTSAPFKGTILRRSPRYIGSSIFTFQDLSSGQEITTFVLITTNTWELYEYSVPIDTVDNANIKPKMICCGKSTGEYGENFKALKKSTAGEFVAKSDSNQTSTETTTDCDSKLSKLLTQWEFFHCKLTHNHLVISGSNGVLRLFNVNSSAPYEVGQPIYTYYSEYPIRCVSISPNDQLIATSITAIREMPSAKEQAFIILHSMEITEDLYLRSITRVSISLPSRDPIKQICFNPLSTHILCCTAWEGNLLIIKLKSYDSNDNYRKPRLIYTGKISQPQSNDDDLLRATEGITNIQFGSIYSNNIIVTSSSLLLRGNPPMILHLDGPTIDTKPRPSLSDSYSIQNSFNSMENEEDYSIRSSEIIRQFPEVGTLVYNSALSPRGDGVVFLSKDGTLYLVSTPNFKVGSTTSSSMTKITVILGEVAGAEKYQESASIKFSPDGAKVFAVDRKGVFSVFDFSKGVPGQDLDVVRCRIVNS